MWGNVILSDPVRKSKKKLTQLLPCQPFQATSSCQNLRSKCRQCPRVFWRDPSSCVRCVVVCKDCASVCCSALWSVCVYYSSSSSMCCKCVLQCVVEFVLQVCVAVRCYRVCVAARSRGVSQCVLQCIILERRPSKYHSTYIVFVFCILTCHRHTSSVHNKYNIFCRFWFLKIRIHETPYLLTVVCMW